MRILHIGDEIWDSGLTEYSLALALAQKAAERDVLFMARTGSYASKRAFKRGLQGVTFRGWRAYMQLMKLVSDFAPHIINAHTGSAHTLAVALNQFAPHRAAVIRTRADARPLSKKLFSNMLWKRTNGFMAANSQIMANFVQFGHPKVVSALVPQGIADKFQAERLPKKDNVFRVAIVARLDPVKGHRVALEAFAILLKTHPDARLEIAGEDKNVSADQLKSFADRLGILRSVEFRAKVPNVFAYMSGFDVGLVPSLYSEAVSRSALEWLCCQTPVIASSVGGLPDIVSDGENGFLVPPGNAEKLAEALGKLASDADLARKMGAQARADYLAKHTPQVFEKAAYDLYEKALRDLPH